MKARSIEKALCILLFGLGATQGIGQTEETVSKDAGTEAVFAYRSFSNRGLVDYMFPSGPWSLPSYVPVELQPLDASAWANATIGSTVTFRVVRGASAADVFNGGLIEAQVTRVRTGKLQTRRGKLEPRVLEVAVGLVKLKLESTPRSRFVSTVKHVGTAPLRGVGFIAEVPLWVVLAIGCSTGGCDF